MFAGAAADDEDLHGMQPSPRARGARTGAGGWTAPPVRVPGPAGTRGWPGRYAWVDGLTGTGWAGGPVPGRPVAGGRGPYRPGGAERGGWPAGGYGAPGGAVRRGGPRWVADGYGAPTRGGEAGAPLAAREGGSPARGRPAAGAEQPLSGGRDAVDGRTDTKTPGRRPATGDRAVAARPGASLLVGELVDHRGAELADDQVVAGERGVD
ncbi:hypothetical protein GCM10027028_28570 [Streptomyces sundarbansensis]